MKNLRVNQSDPKENAGDISCEEIKFYQAPTREYENSIISKLISTAIIHALEASLTALLSPMLMWQWLSKHDHFRIILRVIFEVILELVMWIVFAGVLIMTTAALILDDVYFTSHYTIDVSKSSNTNENYRKL